MADVLVNHAFVSSKPDSADASIVSSSEWNAAALFANGLQGQLLARSSSSLTGAVYIDGAKISLSPGTHSGASPSPSICPLVLTFNTTTFLQITATAVAATSGGATVTIAIERNGSTVDSFVIVGTGTHGATSFVIGEAPGTYTYTLKGTATAGTFTSLAARLIAFSVGAA